MLGYEVDNGTNWSLAGMPVALATSPTTSYEDAGVVVDLGPATQFNGITVAGSNNLWTTCGSATVPARIRSGRTC
jgi:hypothetical protein